MTATEGGRVLSAPGVTPLKFKQTYRTDRRAKAEREGLR
jgi:hypothetical protein